MSFQTGQGVATPALLITASSACPDPCMAVVEGSEMKTIVDTLGQEILDAVRERKGRLTVKYEPNDRSVF